MALSVDKALSKAQKHAKNGETAEAEALYMSVLERFPANQRARQGLDALRMPGINTKKVAPQDPPKEQMDALKAMQNAGRLDALSGQAHALLQTYPASFFLHSILGFVHALQGRPKEAIPHFKQAATLKENAPEVYCNLGIAYKMTEDNAAAEAALKQAIALKPEYAEAYNNLGAVYQGQNRQEEAVVCYQKSLQFNPNAKSVKGNLVRALVSVGDERREHGDSAAALAIYEQVLKMEPGPDGPYYNYSLVKRFTPDNPHLAAMRDLAKADGLSQDHEIKLQFALAKAEMDIGNKQAGFAHLLAGNTLRREQLQFTFDIEEKWASDIQTYFKAFDATSFGPYEPLNFRPIFILGMPRSGTSLTEQILAAHSKVHGGGELVHFHEAADATTWYGDERAPQTFAEIRKRYAEKIAELTDKPVVTDKLPHNFGMIGFIALAFPEAIIINMQREPEAVCWSNFKTYFNARGLGFSHDLQDVARYYNLYLDFMDFWRTRFPGVIHDLNYEKLTEDPEVEVRKLLTLVGLDWEDGVMDFHKSNRQVKTASATQVRKKIYTGSSREWEEYRDYLKPMLDILHSRDIAQ